MNPIHYIGNRFNLNFQLIWLHAMNNFMIWYPYSQLHKNQYHELYNFISQRTIHLVKDSPYHSPWPAITRHHTIGHRILNKFGTMLMRPTLFPQSNPRPHYTLKSTRVRTPTTLALCCLLWCTMFNDQFRRTNTACFSLWGTVVKDQRKNGVKAQGFWMNTNTEEPMNNEKTTECERKRQKVENMNTTECESMYEIGLQDSWSY